MFRINKVFENDQTNIFLLNCLTAVKNLVHAAGWSESVLE